MKFTIQPGRELFRRDPMLYGHFLEHFHRQVYGGLYDPGHPLADEDGFRTDVIEALKRIRTPIIRWPGGCFVSAYHWKKGVGPRRTPVFDKAWRIEDPNTFGTDEFIRLCRKIGCEPYICTNAGTGTAEEMSDWVEYCNLAAEGEFARLRIENGHPEPYGVRYWSVGNENYGSWEIGAKSAGEWGRLVLEAAKMMKRVDPTVSLTAAALVDLDWNIGLLKHCAEYLDWISIHAYWDALTEENRPSSYDQCMSYTARLDEPIQRVRGLLTAMGLEKKIRIAFDEWNLRGWHHPNTMSARLGVTKEEYLQPRDLNDVNSTYTMADAVFSACFLNTLLRNADLVGMANFSPMVNTRGGIFTYDGGIVLRPTYHVFDLYVNHMGDVLIDCWEHPSGADPDAGMPGVDLVATKRSADGAVVIAAVNKHPAEKREVTLELPCSGGVSALTLAGAAPEDYNDIGRNSVFPTENPQMVKRSEGGELVLDLPAHSVNIVTLGGKAEA